MRAFIKAVSYFLPDKILSNEELIREFPEWSAEKVAGKIGINERHIASDGETSADMAVKAARNLFTEHSIDPSEIDFTLLCTQSPDFFLPTSACIIQNRLGIPKKSGAFDFNLGCSGFVYGLAIAKGLILSGTAKNILLLTSETYSKFIHPRDKSNRTIFGDGAAATLISDSGSAEILNFSFGTDGSGFDKLIVRTGGMINPKPFYDLRIDEDGNPVSSDHLFMDGTEIFNFSLEMVPELVTDTLLRNSLEKKDIDLFIFHQANKYLLNFLRKKIQIPEDIFYYSMEKTGNTVSSTIPIAMYEALKEKRITTGQKVLIAGFGVGFSWGGNILKY